jgi:hypothetical protein
MAITPMPSVDTYVQHVHDYCLAVSRVCEYVIWICLNAVVGDPEQPQNNALLDAWNQEGVYTMLAGCLLDVYVIDMWEKSHNFKPNSQ